MAPRIPTWLLWRFAAAVGVGCLVGLIVGIVRGLGHD